MFNKKKATNDKVILFHEDHSCSVHKVIEVLGNSVETDQGLLDISDARKVPDFDSGGTIYLFNVDIPAKVEAENLKQLRRSVALRRMFEYDKAKGLNIMSLMPWIFAFAVLIFK